MYGLICGLESCLLKQKCVILLFKKECVGLALKSHEKFNFRNMEDCGCKCMLKASYQHQCASFIHPKISL